VPSSSESSILRRTLVSWTHWSWRGRQDDPLNWWELLIQQSSVTSQITHPTVQCHIQKYSSNSPVSHPKLLIQQYNVTSQTTWIFYRTTPLTSVLYYITMSESFDKRQQTQLFINKTNHLVWMVSSMSTYWTQLDVTYTPLLDSFHICHSKGWGKDVHKVGSYCIFSNTNIFQDPRSKACT